MLDLIFPETCPACDSLLDKNGKLCKECLSGISFIGDFSSCGRCGLPFGFFNKENKEKEDSGEEEGHLCGKCLSEAYGFTKARSVALYDGKLIDIIHGFKYSGRLGLGGFLSGLLIDNMPYDKSSLDVIVPVPLHIKKLRSREYNQSAVLAKGLASGTGVKHDLFSLKKTKDTRPQFELKNEDERRRNVKGAFSVTDGAVFRGKSVLLVDDVFTTGSTCDECARVLKASGASEVRVLTLTRGRWV